MLKIICLVVLVGIVPMILGLPWVRVVKPRHKYSFAYSTGFFMMVALYEIVCLPVVLTYGEFETIRWVYSVVLVLACGLSLWCVIRNKDELSIGKKERLHWTEWIYVLAFVVIVGVQIYRGFTYDLTYMSWDDATYTAIATDVYAGNGLFTTDSFNGDVVASFPLERFLAAWIIYPSYLAVISGISVTTVAHTIQYIQMILLAYTTYWFVAGEIVKKRENQLIFMVIVSLFYWFGYHSHYSLTFRLLGPNYQGKAVLAVTLTPLILMVMIKMVSEQYSRMFGVYLFLISIAATALTLWGTGTLIVIVSVPLLFSFFRKERNWKHILYAPWSFAIPALTVGYYLLCCYAV